MMNNARARSPRWEVLVADDEAHLVKKEPQDSPAFIDRVRLGKLIRSDRTEFFDSASEFAAEVARVGGIKMNRSIMLEIETGEKRVLFEEMVAIIKVLHVEGAFSRYYKALDPETRKLLESLEG